MSKIKKEHKPILIAAAVLVVLSVVAVIVALVAKAADPSGTTPSSGTTAVNPTGAVESPAVDWTLPEDLTEMETIELGYGLRILNIDSYTGAYMEDRSNEVVSGVMMILLENASGQALQHAKINLRFGDQTAEFVATDVPADGKVVLLEQSRMDFVNRTPELYNVQDVVFLDALELYPEVFEISGSKNCLTITNVSDQDISGDIYVHFKNYSQGLYYGGITYRAKITDLEAGETKQVLLSHYNPDNCVILMVTWPK